MATKEIILKLLEMYKEMPYLWDKYHKDYRNKYVRYDGQKVLLEIYKRIDPNATVTTMNKKIQNLRTNYSKELRKVKDSYQSGADEIYVPNLYYYEALSFLEACSEPSNTTTDLKCKFESENITSTDDEVHSDTQSSPTSDIPKRKRMKITQGSLLEKQDQLMATAGELLRYKEKEQDWEVFGKSIGLQLRDLDKTKLRITQKIISDAIYYASIGALTHNSFIDLGPPATNDVRTTSLFTSSSYCRQESHPYHLSVLKPPHPSSSPHSSHSSPSRN